MNQERYYKFSEYLKERFGCRVYKIGVDAGFSCPNKDGRISRDSCIYCNTKAFSFYSRGLPRTIEDQIEEGIDFGKSRYAAERFIVYFQANTNTYAPLEILKERYDVVRKFKDVVGIAIGTRPDCVDNRVLDLLSSYTQDYEVWIEYGLQSAHNNTLEFINRGHTYDDFLKAVELSRGRRGIKICAHVIIGLPNETAGDIMDTATQVGHLKLDGVKIHPLHVVRGTRLESLFTNGLCTLLELDTYVNLVVDFLERLWPKTVIQRVTADCLPNLLVGPQWILKKNKVLNEIENKLSKEGRFQGRIYKE